MQSVLILHGIGGHAGIHWQQWLHDELVKQNKVVLMPDLPRPEKPTRKEWMGYIKNLLREIDYNGLTIVAHSLGVVSALDIVESDGKSIEKLICVSGFGGDYGAELNSYFMKEKTVDFEKVRSLIGKSFVIYGDNDPYVPQASLIRLADDLRVEPVVIPNGGHLNTEAGFRTFPLLLHLL